MPAKPATFAMPAKPMFLALALLSALAACASNTSSTGEPRYNIVKGSESAPPQGGIPPDKEAEIQLVLQQRQVSTTKCYQDVLNEKHDRAFQGTVKVLIAVNTTGQATDVKVVGGTLSNRDVESCLVDTIKQFEFPQLEKAGEVQSEFRFRPAY